jgi:hypothetical protein
MRYVTAIEAEQIKRKGLPLQSGNYIANTIAFLSGLKGKNSRKICDGYTMHDTNPKKSVGERSNEVYIEGKKGRIVDREVMSTKYAKKHMDYTTIMSQKNRLRKQIVKAQACIAILEDNK